MLKKYTNDTIYFNNSEFSVEREFFNVIFTNLTNSNSELFFLNKEKKLEIKDKNNYF